MSTLYEALRKAESEHSKKGVFTPQVQEQSSISRLLVIVVITIVAFWACLGAYRLWTDTQRKAAQRAAQEKKAAMAAAQPAVAAVPGRHVRAPGTYGLDGVIYAGPDSLAVINGKYLKIGEKIDNLVVKNILPDSVEVSNTNDNTVSTLKLGE